ncbi:MAG: tryptophan--tRNA ligase [Rickettsiales bacterium]
MVDSQTHNRIFSGVQPTGNLHLGNYLGAICAWVDMQHQYESLFCIVDLHAITVPQDPVKLRAAVCETAAAYIACGIDPVKNIIFPQSSVIEHSELAWILSCNTPIGWLNRMTQFKDKAGKNKEKAPLGLYSYPVLMAADVLLYKTTHVPVGEDQKQHIELARDIAGAFNRNYNTEYFPFPEPIIQQQAARIMSLRDGTKKMSKSDESEYSRIALTDDADTIALKIRKAKSDMVEGMSFDESRPEASNLLGIYAALKGISNEKAADECASLNFADFKKELTEVAVEHLAPISKKMREILNSPDYIDQVLSDGMARAKVIAAKTMSEVRDMVGFLDLK